MAAGNSGVISIGDQVLEIDGMTAAGRTAEQMKSLIAGKRGTRIRMTFRRIEDQTEYTVVLKRGAWGAEHCAVSPEHMDMVDEGRWPDVKSRFDADKSLTNGGTPFRGAY
jgi:C-terminal processing protease CtpA/Prc